MDGDLNLLYTSLCMQHREHVSWIFLEIQKANASEFLEVNNNRQIYNNNYPFVNDKYLHKDLMYSGWIIVVRLARCLFNWRCWEIQRQIMCLPTINYRRQWCNRKAITLSWKRIFHFYSLALSAFSITTNYFPSI